MENFSIVLGVLLALSVSVLIWCIFMILCIKGTLGKFLQFTFGHNYKYSKEWDSEVIETLDTSKVKTFDKHTITF